MEENITDKDFIIPVKGLSAGKHSYEFRLDGGFFREYGSTIIKDADLSANILLEKGAGWMRLDVHTTGSVTVECDRCLDDLVIPVDFEVPLQVKFSKAHLTDDDSDDEFVIMDSSDGELDMSQFLYDYVSINLPLQKVHKDGECNKEMIARLEDNRLRCSEDAENGESDAGVNSPFGNLKELLEKK